jgi:Glycosyl hydrolase catalytic core
VAEHGSGQERIASLDSHAEGERAGSFAAFVRYFRMPHRSNTGPVWGTVRFPELLASLLLRVSVLTALLSVLVPAGTAHARYRVGVGEHHAAMFSTPAWQSLGLRHVRYLVPWDWARTGAQAEVDGFMSTARAQRQDVLVTFGAHLGCYGDGRYSRSRVCRAPSARAYRRAVRKFDNRYPWVRTYSAWNEVNHISQPTFTRPRLAVRYYRVLLRESKRRRFRVLAADVLDTANMHRYLRTFLRYAPGRPRLWGLHNYQDVNNRTEADTRTMLQTVPGRVWMTETGGIVSFGASRQWPYSLSRAARCTRWMFRLADRYDSERRGMKSKISRVYVYNWFGVPRGSRFDAGLVDPDGTPRPAYYVVKNHARKQRRR